MNRKTLLITAIALLAVILGSIAVENHSPEGAPESSLIIESCVYNPDTKILTIGGSTTFDVMTFYITQNGERVWGLGNVETKNGRFWADANVKNLADGQYTLVVQSKLGGNPDDVRKTLDFTIESSVPATGITLNKSSVTITADSNETLVATVTPANCTETVSWKSNKAFIVSVEDGRLIPKAVGSATVTAKVGQYEAKCEVKVEYADLDVSPSSLELIVGSSDSVTITLPEGCSTSDIAVQTSGGASEDKISLKLEGAVLNVVSKTVGDTSIEIIVKNLYLARIPVKVAEKPLEYNEYVFSIKMLMDVDKARIPPGITEKHLTDGFELRATATDAANALRNACDIAGIELNLGYSDDGVIRGWVTSMFGLGDKNLGNNEWKYWIQRHNGSYNQWSLGYYTEGGQFSLTYGKTKFGLEIVGAPNQPIEIGKTANLSVLMLPDERKPNSSEPITWSSSDTSVVTVSSRGSVKAIGTGTAVITATLNATWLEEGSLSTTCTITVVEKGATIIRVTSVSLDSPPDKIAVGQTAELKATVHPTNATQKDVRWSSSDPSVIDVVDGVITGKRAGKATITVTTIDGGKTAKAVIECVPVEVRSISLKGPSSGSIGIGETFDIEVIAEPEDASGYTLTWKSSDPSVASVSDGKITGKSRGTVEITATTSNGKTASMSIAVTANPPKPIISIPGSYTYTGSDITVPVEGYDPETMTMEGNVGRDAGDYTVTVKPKDSWSDGTTAAVTAAWTIAKADPTYTAPTGLKATKGDRLSSVALPKGWAWVEDSTVLEWSGDWNLAAVFTPEDTKNYNTAEAKLTVTVSGSDDPPVPPHPHEYSQQWSWDDAHHWRECACGARTDISYHEYEWTVDKEPTAAETGIKHGKCKVCGRETGSVVMDKLPPTIDMGDGSVWKGTDNLVFRSDAAFADFVAVLVDDKTVDSTDYELRNGSIVVELKATFLKTLKAGPHTLTIRSTSGDANASFTVESEEPSPVEPSEGSSDLTVYVIIAIVACAIIAVLAYAVRRKNGP